ncbi:MAG: hypothetical protein IRZ03_08465 [Acidobacterium ailaaui]|nr:hypothetical protein [Pseudacidobacterium ailaaui]
MTTRHVRARCRATGAIAALPERALELGHIPGWEKVPGPVPRRPKPSAFPDLYTRSAEAESNESQE